MAGGFEALGLAPELVRAVTEDLGYLLPSNVQVIFLAFNPHKFTTTSSPNHVYTAGGVRSRRE